MKTINIKTIAGILFFIFHFPFSIDIKAQTDADKKAMCNSYLKATYIFEGKEVSGKQITVKTGQYTYANYMAYLVEIDKVIKGNIKKGTIEILEFTPGVYYRGPEGIKSGPEIDDGPSYPPAQGLYFCYDTTGTGKASHFTNFNAKTLYFHDGIQVTNDKIQIDPRGLVLGNYFSTLSDFYAYLTTNYGIKIEDK